MNKARIDLAASTVALVAIALWVGGMVALGACAAPIVFGMIPAPLSGDTMGTIFRRFDVVAIGCAVVVLGAEALRIAVATAPPTRADRARGVVALAMAASSIYIGLVLSPGIMALHATGAVRGFGADGAALERLHRIAELLGKTQTALGVALIALFVVSLGARPGEPPRP